jgi:hypothetical protein
MPKLINALSLIEVDGLAILSPETVRRDPE